MDGMLVWIVIAAVVVIGVGYVVLMAVLDRFQGWRRREADPAEEEHLEEGGQVHDVARHPGKAARHHEDVDEVVRNPDD